MKLIVGLGNIGVNYENTRHNIGFKVVEQLALKYDFTKFCNKCNSLISLGEIAGSRLILVKPITYMNNSGIALRKLIDYYKLTVDQILVIHDDLDLSYLTIKYKIAGGHGGHNGLRSIINHIGNDYQRLRIGIGRPCGMQSVADYVLSNFSQTEQLDFQHKVNLIINNFFILLNGEVNLFIYNINNH